jgi:hypothetical protein
MGTGLDTINGGTGLAGGFGLGTSNGGTGLAGDGGIGLSGSGGVPPAVPAFVFEVDTSIAGTSGVNHFQLPFKDYLTYDCNVDWGDGSDDDITTYNQAEADHDYGAASTYTIIITGTFPRFQFGNAGDKLKIITVTQCDALDISDANVFYGCTGLTTFSAVEPPIITSLTLGNTFRDCTALATGDFANWPTGSVTNFSLMFQNDTLVNPQIDTWDWSSVTTIQSMLFNADAFDRDLGSVDIGSITVGTDFMKFAIGLSTANYDSLLIGWEGQPHSGSITIHFGSSTYTGGGAAATARAQLITDGWTITDGGIA